MQEKYVDRCLHLFKQTNAASDPFFSMAKASFPFRTIWLTYIQPKIM